MPKLRVHSLSMSVDGFVAGPDQSLDNPLGVGGESLHTWALATRTARAELGEGEGGESGVDDDMWRRGTDGIGATIMGRNMFGPVRGPWPDESWTGWWGPNPPYHHPVFVLTHHVRPPIEMDGGTTYHFVDDGIESALKQAFDAAGGADVRIGGGASTVRQYLAAGLVDELHVPIAPVLLGSGERLFEGLDPLPESYEIAEVSQGEGATHVLITKR
jgi:dihydrofolate reductase